MFGRLTSRSFQARIQSKLCCLLSMVLGGIGIIGLITYLKRWKWLWNEWLTTVDPKRIGIMYIVVVSHHVLQRFCRCSYDALQQALSVGDAHGFISPGHFQEVFSAHGTTMIFFVGMGVVFGLMNLIIPLQIGARDVAYPFLNALGFWLFAQAAILALVSLAIGKFSAAGWLAYPPLSGIRV